MNPDHTTVWRGSVDAPTHEQGITVLGTPLGHDDFIRAHLEQIAQEDAVLLERIPSVPDTQSAWALLLHCANARASYCLRVVRPDVAEDFAHAHNAGLWQCLSDILRVSPDLCDRLSRDFSSLPLSMGGLGLRNAVRTSAPAFWASWADSLQMVHERHPVVAERIVEALEGGGNTPTLRAVVETAWSLDGVEGFEPPSWRALSRGARPPDHDAVEMEPGTVRRGWQHEAASRVEPPPPSRDNLAFSGRSGASSLEVSKRSSFGSGVGCCTVKLFHTY